MKGARERGCRDRLEHLREVNLGWLVQDAQVAARKTPLQVLGLSINGAGVWVSEWLKRSDFVGRDLH